MNVRNTRETRLSESWTLRDTFVSVCAAVVCFSSIRCEAQPAPGAEALAVGRELGAMKADTPPAQVYDTWNRFCLAHFGAEKEPLVYGLYGEKLTMVEGGTWVYVSETSACLAWETNLPAVTHVEYGSDNGPEARTAEPERPFYLHVHYLTGLRPNTRYRYRMVSVDERGNRVASPEATFATKPIPGAVPLPGTLAGPPYVLDRPNATYVLDSDIVADGTALEVRAPGVTVDLNGHTVTYHNKTIPKGLFTDEWMSYVNTGAVGLRNHEHNGMTVLNGILHQGAGTNAGNSESTGFIPLYIRSAGKVCVAGVTVDYHSPQNTGMRLRYGKDDAEFHHNVFVDRGCRISNRHAAAVRALSFLGDHGANYRVHHNLVKRTRQMGILGPHELSHNEVYVDSWSVNSFALAPWKIGGVAHHNRVFGTGVNVQGFGWGERDMHLHHNLVHLQGIDTGKNRGKEGWGDQDSMNGLRVTNYGKGGQVRDNLLYHDNLIVINCRGGSQARGTEFFSDETITGLVCRDSVIKVEAEDDRTDQVACVVTHGHPDKADTSLPVAYENMTLISNLCNVRMGDYYGKGSNHHFVRCKLERTGDDERYHTFIVDGQYWSKRHVLLDCTFGRGVRFDDVFWKKTSPKSFYSVKWTLSLATAPNAEVTIRNAAGEVEFEGSASADGSLAVPLTQCVLHMPSKTKTPCLEHVKDGKTPHTIAVSHEGKTKSTRVEMMAARELRLVP